MSAGERGEEGRRGIAGHHPLSLRDGKYEFSKLDRKFWAWALIPVAMREIFCARGGRMFRGRGTSWCLPSCLVAALVVLSFSNVPSAWAQHGTQGTVVVTVVDPSGRVIPGAQLELRDLATNDTRKAVTSDKGSYTFVNLSLGKFSLSISKDGFESQIYNDVVSE